MQNLILIKHAQPQVDPLTPSDQWPLSEAGQARAADLAQRLADQGLQLIFTSKEPKAAQTASILAQKLNLQPTTLDGLEEHDRRNVPHMQSREFISHMALFFQRPAQLVLGNETAQRAKKRIQDAVYKAIEMAHGQSLAIVTHGTVLALFAAEYIEADPFHLWRRMAQPSYLVLELPDWNVREFHEKME